MSFYEEKISHIRDACYANDGQIQTVIATRKFINEHYDQELSLDALAKMQFTSKYHLLRLFKRYYGQTPRQYLIDVRIEKSKEHLASGASVTDSCFSVGFSSLASFSQLFKRKTGKSPRAYQKQQFSRNECAPKS